MIIVVLLVVEVRCMASCMQLVAVRWQSMVCSLRLCDMFLQYPAVGGLLSSNC
jgi:hypothetical protein